LANTLKCHSLIAEVGIVLRGNHMAAALPLFLTHADELGNKFRFPAIEQAQAEGQLFWVARNGECRLSSERLLKIDSARGNARLLFAAVRGHTKDALDVLEEIWAQLSEMAKRSPLPGADERLCRVSELGVQLLRTTAEVELPLSFEQLFPAAAFLRKEIEERLGSSNDDVRIHPVPRFSIALQREVGSIRADTRLTIEPRAGESAGSRIFFTSSPLDSNEHLRLLEDLCAQVGR
jgi:hypothetical protein